MQADKTPRETEKINCDLCLKEIPVSEAQIEEAADYVVYFCGLECYEQWKKRATEEQE